MGDPGGERPSTSFDVEVAGGVATVTLRGELDLTTAPELERVVGGSLNDDSVHTFVFDMSNLAFMDSSGLAVLLQAAARGRVVLRSPSSVIGQIVDNTGLAGVLEIEP